mmetsp:Transcript_165599/g.531507  ORF Transcript_165599/g.531507 Transcript_165599/m.531507 type:complete len:338 (-) Transcript_165599:518-1531(-)
MCRRLPLLGRRLPGSGAQQQRRPPPALWRLPPQPSAGGRQRLAGLSAAATLRVECRQAPREAPELQRLQRRRPRKRCRRRDDEGARRDVVRHGRREQAAQVLRGEVPHQLPGRVPSEQPDYVLVGNPVVLGRRRGARRQPLPDGQGRIGQLRQQPALFALGPVRRRPVHLPKRHPRGGPGGGAGDAAGQEGVLGDGVRPLCGGLADHQGDALPPAPKLLRLGEKLDAGLVDLPLRRRVVQVQPALPHGLARHGAAWRRQSHDIHGARHWGAGGQTEERLEEASDLRSAAEEPCERTVAEAAGHAQVVVGPFIRQVLLADLPKVPKVAARKSSEVLEQ